MLATSKQNAWPARDRNLTVAVAAGWTILALFLLTDLQVGHKLFFSVVMADQSYRVAFTDAVLRTGVPPANPLYFSGTAAPMRYFYFWYVLCAAAARIAHVSARHAFISSSMWCGFGLTATVHLYTNHFFNWSRRQRWIAISLLLVSGADLLPAVGQAILQPSLNGDTEWWSVDPIDSWPDSLLWVPHHVASVLCCLLAFLLLWQLLSAVGSTGAEQPPGETRSSFSKNVSQVTTLALAAAGCSSALGLSVYVAFGFALLMAAWLLRLWLTHDPIRQPATKYMAVLTGLSTILGAPFIRELITGFAEAAHAGTPALHVFTLSTRRMIDSGLITGLPVFAHLNQTHPILLDQTIRLILLLPGLAMELGLFGAVLVFLLVSKRRGALQNPARETVLFFSVVGLILTMFLSSAVITNNDFGYRAVMLPQFFLLLLTADVLGSWSLNDPAPAVARSPTRLRLLHALWVLGALGSIFWAVLLRAWLPYEAAKPGSGFADLPTDAFQIRSAFVALDYAAPSNAVIAFLPIDPVGHRNDEVMSPWEFYQRALVMNAGHQLLNAENKCATHFGGDPSLCPAIQAATRQLYREPLPNALWAQNFCRRFGVDFLALSHRDPAWTSPGGWPATLPVAASQPGFRLLRCR